MVVAQDKEAGILRIKAKARKDQAVGQDCWRVSFLMFFYPTGLCAKWCTSIRCIYQQIPEHTATSTWVAWLLHGQAGSHWKETKELCSSSSRKLSFRYPKAIKTESFLKLKPFGWSVFGILLSLIRLWQSYKAFNPFGSSLAKASGGAGKTKNNWSPQPGSSQLIVKSFQLDGTLDLHSSMMTDDECVMVHRTIVLVTPVQSFAAAFQTETGLQMLLI